MNISSLRRYLLATLAIIGFSTGYAQAQVDVDLALCLDSSGSIGATDYATQRDATVSALTDLLPTDGSVRLSVFQFSDVVEAVYGPTIIDVAGKAAALAAVGGMTQIGSVTNTEGCIRAATAALETAGAEAAKKIIDLSTDGVPTTNVAGADCTAPFLSGDPSDPMPNPCSDGALNAASDAWTGGSVDALNVIAVGPGVADFLWYMDNLVFPTGLGNTSGPNTTGGLPIINDFEPTTVDPSFVGCPCLDGIPGAGDYDSRVLPPYPIPGSPLDEDGFIIPVANFDAYETAIEEKLIQELSTQFTVVKTWTLPPGMSGNEVEIELSCTGDTLIEEQGPGVPVSKLTEGGTATFALRGFSDTDTCVATELNVPAYVIHEEGNCQDPVPIQAVGTCNMYNEVLYGDFTVNKRWAFTDYLAEVMIELSCTGDTLIGGLSSPQSQMTSQGAATFQLTRFLPTDTCTAIETTNTPFFDIFEEDCVGVDILEPGSCLITNYAWPTLTLNKTVVNRDGGQAAASNFQAYIDGVPVDWGVPYPVPPFASVDIAESTLPGYAPSIWTCDTAVTQTGAGTATITSTTEPGGSHTCSITNDDLPASVTLVKTIIDDDGGIATPGDFQVDLAPVGPDVPWGVPIPVPAGVPLLIEEVIAFGWDPMGWTCDAAFTPLAPHIAEIAPLALDQHVTCMLANDDVAPTVTLIKHIVDDDGGVATPADFQAMLQAAPAAWGVPIPVPANVPLDLAEVPTAGWAPQGWVCDLPFDPIGLESAVIIPLQAGQNITCEITNDDIAPTVTLVKNIIDDDGGIATPADFQVDLVTPDVGWGQHSVPAGVPLTITETIEPGWDPQGWSCDTSFTAAAPPFDLNEAVIDPLLPGANVTCTLANDDVAPTVTLIKTVDGGNLIPADFQAYLDPTGGSRIPVPWGEEIPILANQSHGIFEDPAELDPLKYSAQGWGGECTGVPGAPPSAGYLRPLLPGENVTCNITNRADDGRIEIELLLDPPLTDTFDFLGATPATLGHTGIEGVDVRPGAHETRTAKADIYLASWFVVSFECDDGDSQIDMGDPDDLIALFNVDPGETVRCTLTLRLAPDVPVPVNNPWALLLMILMVLGVGWYYRPATMRKF